MSGDRRKQIVRHLTEEELDRLLTEADDDKIVRRLTFVKNLYEGDTLEKAADRAGKSQSTSSRWARRWNKGGLGLLTPNFGGGRPPKLDEDEQEELLDLLREGQPWKPQEIQHLLNEEFDVEYHPVYLGKFLKKLGLSYAIPRTQRPSQPENAEEILEERVGDAFDEDEDDEPHNKQDGDDEEGWIVDDDICTDGGTVLGFFDTSHPQPWDNSQRLYYVDDPHLTRPLVRHDKPTVGFYALNGESVVSFPKTRKKNRSVGVSNESASRIRASGFCSSWTTSPHTSVRTRAGARINLESISSSSRLVRLISIQSSRSGRVSGGKHRRSSSRARRNSELSSPICSNISLTE